MKPIGIFQAYGIEIEYMIVDKETLKVRPIADRVLERASGNLSGDHENGRITWSNELVLHVIELKTSGPDSNLSSLSDDFQKNVLEINQLLESENAMLLPTGMHPTMTPAEKKLWPHDNNEIYEAYDRIFDCRGHGWSNLQSTHINLPFANDAEFRRLHTAVRFLLPVLPALTASSPFVEGKKTGFVDSRLHHYQQNQKKLPSIAGLVIPEPVESKAEYGSTILQKTYADIAPYDPDEMLRDDWLNSRGAIARFGRQTIEIRILDTQENPAADIAIAELIVAILKSLAAEEIPYSEQFRHSTESLKGLFDATIRDGESARLEYTEYLKSWQLGATPISANEFWRKLIPRFETALTPESRHAIHHILESGTLATRIVKKAENASIEAAYRVLADCLNTGKPFN